MPSSSAYLLPDDGSSILISFDLTESEGHEMTAEVTEHPVEAGSNIADHVRQAPQGLTLAVYITNTPTTDLGGRGSVDSFQLDVPRYVPPLAPTPGSLFRLAGAALGSVLGSALAPPSIQVLNFTTPFDRIKETHDTLKDLWTKGVTMSVVTSVRTYDTMVLTKVSLTRTEPGGATFNLDFKQIRTVTTATVKAPAPAEKRGAPGQAKGSQSTKPTGGKDAAKASSVANKALEALGQFLGI